MHHERTNLNNRTKIAFIIPHRGREEMLLQTIDSIVAQNFDLSRVEIIVVTQNQDFNAAILPPSKLAKIRTIIRPSEESISALRNYGVQSTSSEYLAFLDADIQLSPNWLEMMTTELEFNRARVLVSAVQRCESTAPKLEHIRTALSNAVVDKPVWFLPGRNLFLKRDTFLKAGQFPEHLVTCEDYYFTGKVHELGELYYSSKANYVHLGEDKTLGMVFKKEIWRGQSNLKSLRGRSIPLNEWPSIIVPMWLLLFALLLTGAIFAMHGSTIIISLVMILLPILLYATRLYRIGHGRLAFKDVLIFYAYYFPARVIGTLGGIFLVFSAK